MGKATGESSAQIRERVEAARRIQARRFALEHGVYCNAQMNAKQFEQYCMPDAAGNRLLKMAMEKLGLSARAYTRILKVARTIADLDGKERIGVEHLSEAINYRSLDRDNWGK